MSPPLVFSKARAVVAPIFVDRIPNDICREDFLHKTCTTFNLSLEKNGSNEVFSFEGHWNDLVNVEDFLKKHLIDWCTAIQTSKYVAEGNHGLAVSKPIETSPRKKTFKSTSEKPVCSNVTLNASSNVEVIVADTQECHEIILDNSVTLGDQNTEVNDCQSTGQNDQNNVGSISNNKSPINHENEIYMDIKLSHRPPNGLFKESGDAPVTLVMGTEESVIEAVCLDSSKNKKVAFDQNIQPDELGKDKSSNKDWKKLKSKRYEEKAQFKFFCTQCSFKSKRASHLKKHSLFHERVCKLYSCDHCDFSTIRLGHLQRHIMQHSDLQFACSACSYRTNSRSLLRKHQNLKHKPGESSPVDKGPKLRCSECNYSTTREKFLERHQVVHAGGMNVKKGGKNYFECSKCSYKTTTKSNLARHSNTVHDGDRPYLCSVCGQGFKRSDTLNQHLVVHASGDSKMADLQCPHCQKFYRSKPLLHEHILVHSNTRSYLCEICGAAFKTRANQRKHVLLVHSPKIFPCNQCSKKFNTKFSLKRHLKLHQPKTVSQTSLKKPQKLPDNVISTSDQWSSSVMTLPVPEDIQVLVVQQEDLQQGVILNEGAIFVQDSTDVQLTSEDLQQGVILNEGAIFVQDSTDVQLNSIPDLSKTVNVPVLPVEYVLPEEMASQLGSSTNLSSQFSLQDGAVITLQFVQ